MRRALLVSLVAAIPLGFTTSKALGEPVWWLGVAASLGLVFALYFAVLRVRLYRKSAAPRTQ